VLDVAEDPVQRRRLDQRSDRGGVVSRVTDDAFVRLAGECGELLLDRALHQDPGSRAAVLPRVPERGFGQVRGDRVELVATIAPAGRLRVSAQQPGQHSEAERRLIDDIHTAVRVDPWALLNRIATGCAAVVLASGQFAYPVAGVSGGSARRIHRA
jgi:hypothetical protein